MNSIKKDMTIQETAQLVFDNATERIGTVNDLLDIYPDAYVGRGIGGTYNSLFCIQYDTDKNRFHRYPSGIPFLFSTYELAENAVNAVTEYDKYATFTVVKFSEYADEYKKILTDVIDSVKDMI